MKKLAISIIDDDKIYHFTTTKTILSLGLNVDLRSFFDGEEALNYIKSNLSNPNALPDTIFLDINMPVMDGWDFLNDYVDLEQQLPKTITIYMVSSSQSETDMNKANSYKSISGYLVKPVAKNQFYNLINSMVA